MERRPRAILKRKEEREGEREKRELCGGNSLPPPQKAGIRFFVVDNHGKKKKKKKWGKAMKILGRGEDSFALADADTWPNLTSP